MRFKDLRGTFLSFLLFILDIALIINGIMLKNKLKIIVSILIIPIILVGYLRQFYIHVNSDCMLLHHFIGILSMPVFLNFNEITDIICVNKYKINVVTKKRKYGIYCINAHKKVIEMKRKWDEYNAQN